MSKLTDAYNKCKPTTRQIKKQKKNNADAVKFTKMRDFLEKKWSNTVNYQCVHCLQEAYYCELNNTQGYVTDEELIVSSNNKLRHK